MRFKRLTAILLATIMIFSSGYTEAFAAEPTVQMKSESEVDTTVNDSSSVSSERTSTETVDAEVVNTEVVNTEVVNTEIVNTEVVNTEVVNTEVVNTEVISTEATSTETTNTETVDTADLPLINYVVVDQQQITCPGAQHVVIGIGDGSQTLTKAVLTYKNQTTKEEYTVDAATLSSDAAMFSMDCSEEMGAGIYELISLSYETAKAHGSVVFTEIGVSALFGVETDPNAAPDDVILDQEQLDTLAEDTSMNVVSIDQNGNTTSENNVKEALGDAQTLTGSSKGADNSADATGMSSVVVVLDPGHGGSDGGATGNGITEKIVNLKIAQYCKAALEAYNGVTVYLTRTTDTFISLESRIAYAASVNATVFVSLHNNASTSSTANGANVYYPNANYNAAVSTTGSVLSATILAKLTALGLASGGTHIRNSETKDTYDDGSLADYYAIIRGNKKNNIPAIIVEHAFVSNASDAANYLSSDAKLKALGEADAAGIAEYFGLSKGFGFQSITSTSSTGITLNWKTVSGVTGYQIARSTSNASDFTLIKTVTGAGTGTFTDTGINNDGGTKAALVTGTTYYYKIRTYTGSGHSAWSTVQSCATIEVPVITAIKSMAYDQLKISWNVVNNATTYHVYRSSDNTNFTQIATVNGINNLSYTDKTVSAGVLYYYKLQSTGTSAGSNVRSGDSVVVSGRTAGKITTVKARGVATNTIRVYWNPVSNVDGFSIFRSTSKTKGFKKIATVTDKTATRYEDTTVTKAKTYYYKVESFIYNNGIKGYSKKSDSVGSTKTVRKTAITSLSLVDNTSVLVKWKKIASADGYQVYRSTQVNGTYTKIAEYSKKTKIQVKDTNLAPNTTYYYKVITTKKVNKKTCTGSDSLIKEITTPIQTAQ